MPTNTHSLTLAAQKLADLRDSKPGSHDGATPTRTKFLVAAQRAIRDLAFTCGHDELEDYRFPDKKAPTGFMTVQLDGLHIQADIRFRPTPGVSKLHVKLNPSHPWYVTGHPHTRPLTDVELIRLTEKVRADERLARERFANAQAAA